MRPRGQALDSLARFARSAFFLLLGSAMLASIQEDQLECEQAVARLDECCAPFDASEACGDGCSPITLTVQESRCIQNSDCETLVTTGVCRRVDQLSRAAWKTSDNRAEVCP
jgi:hypothetical protein